MKTTLDDITRAANLRWTDWKKLLSHLGKSGIDRDPLDFLDILNGIGISDTLRILDRVAHGSQLQRRAKAAFAEQVLHLFEREEPAEAPRLAIAAARDDSTTPEALNTFAQAAEDAGEALGVARSRLKEVGPWKAGVRSPARAAWAAADAARPSAGAARVAEGATEAWALSVGGYCAQEACDLSIATQDSILRGLLKKEDF